ncbi:MAG: serine/threonine protein kinase [Acidobacteriia bacterium]|nr:serine/threonine protein kinase [Terriglobia bacterium]
MPELTGDWERLESLFTQAADLPPAERARYLDALSATDPALARELTSLLDCDGTAHQRLHGIMDRVVADASRLPQWSGQVFGSYRVVRTIAAGGMGTVFEAVREQDYHKRVALKVAASAIGTPAWVERFQQERQILAGLDHPHIARFLDGGASAEGLPYFAMELVEGEPITAFARNRKAGLRERIELFRKVCAAVSFAHQSLVVHRDLKPGNILVTADGEPKLLDFGLAKLQSPLEPDLGLTQTAVPLLTPAYCSPEQVLGGKITTRVDVYLLGLILFELLTGEQAHQLTGGSPAELQQAVSEAEAPVPSARAAEARELALAKSLRGDLDTIVVKAIQKDPARRYQSVDELNEDLARYLDGRPILARPAGWSYRAAKFLRRHWIPAGAAAAVFLALIIGALAFAWQARIAERRFELTRKIAHALLFDIHDKVQAMPEGIELRELISSTAVEYLDALSKEAGRNYALRRELAAGYLRLGSARWSKSEAAPSHTGGDSTLSTLNRAIALLEGMPSSELALAAATEAGLRDRRGAVLQQSSKTDAAIADFERALAVAPCTAGRSDLCEVRISALGHLFNSYAPLQDWPACQTLLAEMRRAMETLRPAGGEITYQQRVLFAGFLQMKILETQGRHAEAAENLRRLLPVAEQLGAQTRLGPNPLRELAHYYCFLGRCLRRAGESTPRERIEFLRKSLEFAQRYLKLDSADISAQFSVGLTLTDMAEDSESVNPGEAARLYQKAAEPFLQRPEVIANDLEPRIDLYDTGCLALRFFLRSHRPEEAVSLARRISAVMSPAMFLGLNLPRSEEAQRIQALWWTASEAVEARASSAERLWGQAVREAQEGLLRTPQDAVIQASAAFAFEGWAEWLRTAGRQADGEVYGKQSQALWSRLSAAFPANGFLRTHAQGPSPFESHKN